MRRSVVTVLLFAAAACGTGDSLVVVTVASGGGFEQVSALNVHAQSAARSVDFYVLPRIGETSVRLPDTFAIAAPARITGTLAIHLQALSIPANATVSGDGAALLAPGSRTDVLITLLAGLPPGDLAPPPDLSPADLAPPPLDLTSPPPDFSVSCGSPFAQCCTTGTPCLPFAVCSGSVCMPCGGLSMMCCPSPPPCRSPLICSTTDGLGPQMCQ